MRNIEPTPAPSRARREPSTSTTSPAQPQSPSEERKANRLSLRSSPFFYPESGPGGVKAAKRPKGLALTPPGPDSTLLKGNFLHHTVRYTPTRKVMFPLNQYKSKSRLERNSLAMLAGVWTGKRTWAPAP